ncbi:MAG: rod shape-determining protein MreC [Methyloceanibacter sp.]|uniref:rod shape-determining protein MreC n=1 Tax=Methyloceanibacter sp. TaxID=1965321 RepID=UPI003EE3B8AD
MRERGSPLFRRHRPSWRAPVELLSFGLYFLCAVLLVLSRIGHGAISDARDGVVDLSAPLLEVASLPAIEARRAMERVELYMAAFDEVDRLKKENEELKQWEWRTKLLERKVAHLRSLLNAVEEPALVYATGRVIADARGPFVRSALINLGRRDGLRIGYAVINGDGLVGRTVDAGHSVARVLLLNDLNSRIPVLAGPAGVRGLASGDNSTELQLDFLPEGAALYPGDEVYTSGSDGVLPRGLRVGVVAGSLGAYKVRPYAELNSLDAVSVLFFDAPALTRADPPGASDGLGALSAAPVAGQKTATASAGLPMTVVPPPTGEQAQAER